MILNEIARVTLDGSGNGIVQAGPQRVSQRWKVTGAAVLIPNAVLIPQFFLYYGPLGGNSLGGSFSGSNDSTDFPTPIDLGAGQFLTGQWLGGDPGAVATLTIYGELISKAGG